MVSDIPAGDERENRYPFLKVWWHQPLFFCLCSIYFFVQYVHLYFYSPRVHSYSSLLRRGPPWGAEPGFELAGLAYSKPTLYDNLSRRLQPGYNYVGQTNDPQPLLISAVGRLRDYLPTADCCVGPGQRAPNPPSTLIPAVGCRSRILKHSHPPTLRMAAAQDGRGPIGGGKLLWPIATLLVHLRFRHPSPLRPAVQLLGLSLVPSPSGLASRLRYLSSPGRPPS